MNIFLNFDQYIDHHYHLSYTKAVAEVVEGIVPVIFLNGHLHGEKNCSESLLVKPTEGLNNYVSYES